MRRIVVIAVGLLAIDQVSKTLAGHLLADREVMLAPEWGLTYVTNPGLWIWPDPPDIALFVIQGAAVVVAVLLALGARWYSRWYRRSLLVDVAVAFLALGVLGNLLDRLFIGGARDWVVTPIATGNLADVAGWATLALLIAEVVVFPPSRRLLAIDPRRWRPVGRPDLFG